MKHNHHLKLVYVQYTSCDQDLKGSGCFSFHQFWIFCHSTDKCRLWCASLTYRWMVDLMVCLSLVSFWGAAVTLFKCERKEVSYSVLHHKRNRNTQGLCLYKVKCLTSAHSIKHDRLLTLFWDLTMLRFGLVKWSIQQCNHSFVCRDVIV